MRQQLAQHLFLINPFLTKATNALISLLYFDGYLPSTMPKTIFSNYNLSFLEFFSHLLWFIFHLHWHQSLFTFYCIFPKCLVSSGENMEQSLHFTWAQH